MTEERTLLRGRIPKVHVDALDAWADFGVKPSGLLRRVITNDLFGAMELALSNPKLLAILPDLVVYLANHCPPEAWGSAQVLDSWTGLQNRPH